MGLVAFAEEMPSHEFHTPNLLSGHGPPVFIMHGRPCHTVSTLYPAKSTTTRKYGQLYIYDAAEACRQRASCFEGLREDIFLSLATLPESSDNPYPADYRNMHTLLQQKGSAHAILGLPAPVAQMCFHGGREPDPRRYNVARGDEVAIVFAGEGAPRGHYISVFSNTSQESLKRPKKAPKTLEKRDPKMNPKINNYWIIVGAISEPI